MKLQNWEKTKLGNYKIGEKTKFWKLQSQEITKL